MRHFDLLLDPVRTLLDPSLRGTETAILTVFAPFLGYPGPGSGPSFGVKNTYFWCFSGPRGPDLRSYRSDLSGPPGDRWSW